MEQLTVTADQARLISSLTMPIILVDPEGRTLGRLTPIDAEFHSEKLISNEELAEVKRRMKTPGPGLTTKELLNYLHSLDKA
jgi:hypothetical protein